MAVLAAPLQDRLDVLVKGDLSRVETQAVGRLSGGERRGANAHGYGDGQRREMLRPAGGVS